MNLTLDIGNTRIKIIVFEDTVPVYRIVTGRLSLKLLREILKTFPVQYCMCSSVVSVDKGIVKLLRTIPHFITFKSSIPVRNKYKTPSTLGSDRLANAIAGAFLFPGKNVLIVDTGTCVKYDFVNAKGEYLGGSISPGMEMRFRSMHEFTGKLPLVQYEKVSLLTGNTTVTAMQTGVITGMREEIKGFINLYKNRFGNVKIILTGGDMQRFVNDLNLSIFAAADLVNIGLNEVIRFNSKDR
jgi:type III pantothenate kinase